MNPIACGRARHSFLFRARCALLLAGTLIPALMAAPPARAAEVVLGSPTYVPNGSGFGTPHPSSIFNGGVPSGLVTHISWHAWGSKVATGTGRTSIYKPQGGYYAKSGKVSLRAENIGQCSGQSAPAYTVLLVREPPWPGGPLGSWFKWSGTKTICDYNEQDPRYEYPKRPPGDCGQLGKDYKPADLFDIRAYRVSCSRARRVAVHSRSSFRNCKRNECTTRRDGFRCHWQALHSGETSPSLDAAYPVQRVSCKHGRSTLSWWRVVGAE